jgi:hypothetical protein
MFGYDFNYYWSSSSNDGDDENKTAWCAMVFAGYQSDFEKYLLVNIRCIRAGT